MLQGGIIIIAISQIKKVDLKKLVQVRDPSRNQDTVSLPWASALNIRMCHMRTSKLVYGHQIHSIHQSSSWPFLYKAHSAQPPRAKPISHSPTLVLYGWLFSKTDIDNHKSAPSETRFLCLVLLEHLLDGRKYLCYLQDARVDLQINEVNLWAHIKMSIFHVSKFLFYYYRLILLQPMWEFIFKLMGFPRPVPVPY